MYTEAAGECIAALGGMTLAIKAQHALLDGGIAAEVLALSPTQTKRGCAYGVSFPCARLSAVRAGLQACRIPVSQFIERKEPPA